MPARYRPRSGRVCVLGTGGLSGLLSGLLSGQLGGRLRGCLVGSLLGWLSRWLCVQFWVRLRTGRIRRERGVDARQNAHTESDNHPKQQDGDPIQGYDGATKGTNRDSHGGWQSSMLTGGAV